MRRSRCTSRLAVSASSESRAFSTASSTSRRFSPRAGARTSTRDPRRSLQELRKRTRVGHGRRDEHLRRDTRRRAVVLDGEGLQHRERVVLDDVLEVEAVAVDHLAVAEGEDLHRRAVALYREPDHVHRSAARCSVACRSARWRMELSRFR